MELSHKAEDIQEIKASILKVAQQRKKGRHMSRMLMDNINAEALMRMGIVDETFGDK